MGTRSRRATIEALRQAQCKRLGRWLTTYDSGLTGERAENLRYLEFISGPLGAEPNDRGERAVILKQVQDDGLLARSNPEQIMLVGILDRRVDNIADRETL